MIDTDKYEGHSIGWVLGYDDWTWAESMFTGAGITNEADALLIADAPKLLAEVKRLREQYTELREALVGDSTNWTHEELIEKALELIDNE